MKTEQEQIEEIENVLINEQMRVDYSVEGHKQLMQKGVYYCQAKAIVDAGYGDVSKHKAEIERLRTTLGQCNTELNSALKSLKSQCREIGELKAKVKQAKIEVLNKVIERAVGLAAIETYHICNLIDEIIKEVQDGEDKG